MVIMLRTHQIATVGEDTDTVLIGLRNIPAHRLDLLCLKQDRESVGEFAQELERTLKIEVEVHLITEKIVESVLENVALLLKQHRNEFDDVVLNVAGGDKTLTCAAVSAAYFNGVKAFHLMGDVPVLLPVLKVSYSKVISDAKLKILQKIHSAGGGVKSLKELSEISGYGKPLLSYHINGDDESRGLTDLGLVEVEHKRRGRLQIVLTMVGRAMVLGQ
ncbi:MAG: HFX_2341 family transcriptional regulator domain-containing protein [Candidatus Thorarchaeota archaeon]|jgi:DNA-binding transcriptional ArsR family regulator